MHNEEKDNYRYGIRLLIIHPNIDPAVISSKLQLRECMRWMAGTKRQTPTGTPLPGIHSDTRWGYSFEVEENRFFFNDVKNFLKKLEPHKEFILELTDTGGSVSIIVNLPGDINIGDTFEWKDLELLISLRIDLGVEVFPHFS